MMICADIGGYLFGGWSASLLDGGILDCVVECGCLKIGILRGLGCWINGFRSMSIVFIRLFGAVNVVDHDTNLTAI